MATLWVHVSNRSPKGGPRTPISDMKAVRDPRRKEVIYMVPMDLYNSILDADADDPLRELDTP